MLHNNLSSDFRPNSSVRFLGTLIDKQDIQSILEIHILQFSWKSFTQRIHKYNRIFSVRQLISLAFNPQGAQFLETDYVDTAKQPV